MFVINCKWHAEKTVHVYFVVLCNTTGNSSDADPHYTVLHWSSIWRYWIKQYCRFWELSGNLQLNLCIYLTLCTIFIHVHLDTHPSNQLLNLSSDHCTSFTAVCEYIKLLVDQSSYSLQKIWMNPLQMREVITWWYCKLIPCAVTKNEWDTKRKDMSKPMMHALTYCYMPYCTNRVS